MSWAPVEPTFGRMWVWRLTSAPMGGMETWWGKRPFPLTSTYYSCNQGGTLSQSITFAFTAASNNFELALAACALQKTVLKSEVCGGLNSCIVYCIYIDMYTQDIDDFSSSISNEGTAIFGSSNQAVATVLGPLLEIPVMLALVKAMSYVNVEKPTGTAGCVQCFFESTAIDPGRFWIFVWQTFRPRMFLIQLAGGKMLGKRARRQQAEH